MIIWNKFQVSSVNLSRNRIRHNRLMHFSWVMNVEWDLKSGAECVQEKKKTIWNIHYENVLSASSSLACLFVSLFATSHSLQHVNRNICLWSFLARWISHSHKHTQTQGSEFQGSHMENRVINWKGILPVGLIENGTHALCRELSDGRKLLNMFICVIRTFTAPHSTEMNSFL